MANLFDNLSTRVLSKSQSIAGDAIAKAIPGDGFIAKQARGFLTAQSARLLSSGLFRTVTLAFNRRCCLAIYPNH